VLVPPNFDPTPGFPEAQAIADSLFSALEHARPVRAASHAAWVVCQNLPTNMNISTQNIKVEMARSKVNDSPKSFRFAIRSRDRRQGFWHTP